MHPNLLYTERKLTTPSDCYDIKGCLRAHVKSTMLILIKAETIGSAVLSLAAKIENVEREQKGQKSLTKADSPSGYHIEEASRLIDAVKIHHKGVSGDFHSGSGLRLQNKDSDIAEDVWWKMYKQGTVILPVHDSFIVQASQADKLKEVMIQAFERIAKVALTVTR